MRMVAVDAEYEFRVEGRLSAEMISALGEMEPIPYSAETVLTSHVTDEAQLHGLIARFESLGLQLTEVRRLPPRARNGVDPHADPALAGKRDVTDR